MKVSVRRFLCLICVVLSVILLNYGWIEVTGPIADEWEMIQKQSARFVVDNYSGKNLLQIAMSELLVEKKYDSDLEEEVASIALAADIILEKTSVGDAVKDMVEEATEVVMSGKTLSPRQLSEVVLEGLEDEIKIKATASNIEDSLDGINELIELDLGDTSKIGETVDTVFTYMHYYKIATIVLLATAALAILDCFILKHNWLFIPYSIAWLGYEACWFYLYKLVMDQGWMLQVKFTYQLIAAAALAVFPLFIGIKSKRMIYREQPEPVIETENDGQDYI